MAKADSRAAAHAAGPIRIPGRSPLHQGRQTRSRGAPIRRECLEAQVYARLRSSIIDRMIQAGHRIPIDRLAQEPGISRTPILEALGRHDSGASETAMRVHIRRSIEGLEVEAEDAGAAETQAEARRGGRARGEKSGRSSGG